MKLNKRFWIILILVLIVASTVVMAGWGDLAKEGGTGFMDNLKSGLFKNVGVRTLWTGAVLGLVGGALLVFFMRRTVASYKLVIPICMLVMIVITAKMAGPNQALWDSGGLRHMAVLALGDKDCEANLNYGEMQGLENKIEGMHEIKFDDKGNEVLGEPKKQGMVMAGLKRVPLVGGMVEGTGERIQGLRDKVTFQKERLEESETSHCYTTASLLPVDQRPFDTSPTSANVLMGWGILRGSRLFVLIGSLLVYFLLFKVLGKGLDKWSRWVLTIMFAITTAKSGTPKSQFLFVAYYVMLFVLYKIFRKKGEEGTGNIMACGFTFAIVHTLATTAFSQYGVGLPFLRNGSFVTNFLWGAGAGLILDKIQARRERAYNERMEKARSGVGKSIWEKKGSIFKWATLGSHVWFPFIAGMIGKGGAAGFKKLKSHIEQNIREVNKETEILIQKNNEKNKLEAKPDRNIEDDRRIEDLKWRGEGPTSKTIEDRKEVFERQRKVMEKKIKALYTNDEKKIEELNKELDRIRDIKERYLYDRLTNISEGNPAHDKKDKDKTIFGILDNLDLELEYHENELKTFAR